MVEVNTHSRIDRNLSGEPEILEDGFAVVKLSTTETMAADEKGLVHGGFIFSAADYSAMLAVNHPNVVLGRAEVKFLKPVKVGDTVRFEAKVEKREGKKIIVNVVGKRGEDEVFTGEFYCVVPQTHVLERS
ncbi:thioesterase, FlK family [Hydrogenivirga sp.]